MRFSILCLVVGFSLAAGCYARADQQAPQAGGRPAIAAGADDLLLAWDDDPPPPEAGPAAPPRPDGPAPPGNPPPRRGERDRDRPRRPPPPDDEADLQPRRPDQPPPPTFEGPGGGRFGDDGFRKRPPGPPTKDAFSDGPPGKGRFGGEGGDRFGPPGGPPGQPGMSMQPRWAMEPADPETMKLAQADAEADHVTRELAEQYRRTPSEEDKKKLREKLAEVVAKHFQIRQEQRELALKRLEKQLNHLREVIAKRTEAKEAIIKNRMNQLLGEPDDLGF